VTDSLEDPRKAELREQLSAALDSAGFDVDDTRAPIPYQAGTELKGPGIKPDVLCVDSSGVRHLYFLRLDASKPLPGWLINNVTASYAITNVEMHVAVTHDSAEIRASCGAVGVGLVKVNEDNTIETVLTYAPPSQTATKKELMTEIKAARRRLENKVELNVGRLQVSFDEITSVTVGMPNVLKDKYRSGIEAESLAWQEWLAEMSERLDAVGTSENASDLTDAIAQIVAKEIP